VKKTKRSNRRTKQPSRPHATVLSQLLQLIPGYLVPKLARETGVDDKARTFSPWSHVVTLLYAQLSHALSLNDVCDALRMWCTPLRALRGATPPSRNALSHANKVRDCAMAEQLFWGVLAHLQSTFPQFKHGATRGMAWRFRRTIHVLDATVIRLVSSCTSWAKHNRRKAAAKCHMRLSLRTLLPTMAVVSSAREHDVARARQLCAGLCDGEIALFDKGYHCLSLFWELTQRGVYFVTRQQENVRFIVVKKLRRGSDPRIIRDELVVTTGRSVEGKYPKPLRRVTARVEVDGEEREFVFLTNNLEWSASSVAELYRCRWQIEAFFKQIKQTLQLADFLGHSANAVKWQVWMALLVYVLLRFQAWNSSWHHSFSRLLTYLRAALWKRIALAELLRRCGTADGGYHQLDPIFQRWLPGFEH
jgi:hypothetical protein